MADEVEQRRITERQQRGMRVTGPSTLVAAPAAADACDTHVARGEGVVRAQDDSCGAELDPRSVPFSLRLRDPDQYCHCLDVVKCGVLSWRALLTSGCGGAVPATLCAPLSHLLDWDATLSVLHLTIGPRLSYHPEVPKHPHDCKASFLGRSGQNSTSLHPSVNNPECHKRARIAPVTPHTTSPLLAFKSLPPDAHAVIASFLGPYGTLRTSAASRQLRRGYLPHVHTVSLWQWEDQLWESREVVQALKRQRRVGVCALFASIGNGLKEVRVVDDGGMDAVAAALTAGHGRCIHMLDLRSHDYDSHRQMLTLLADAMRNERLQSLKGLRLMDPEAALTEYTSVAHALAEGRCPLLESFALDEGGETWVNARVLADAFQARDGNLACGSLRRLDLSLSEEEPTNVSLRGLLSIRSCAGALEGLQLGFNSASDDIVHVIAGYIHSPQAASLQRLNVMLYSIPFEESSSWAPLFRSFHAGGAPAVQELKVQGGYMDEEACAAFGDAIAAGALQRLEVLSLRWVEFDTPAWRRVIRRMAQEGLKCPALREIHVECLNKELVGRNDGQTNAICSVVRRVKGVFPQLSSVHGYSRGEPLSHTETNSEGNESSGNGEGEGSEVQGVQVGDSDSPGAYDGGSDDEFF